MREVPKGWQLNSIHSISSKVGSGSTPRGGSDAYVSHGVPLIRSQNVHFNGFKEIGLAFLNIDQAETLKNVSVEENDVLLNITGASIGRVCLAPAHLKGARVNQHVFIIRTNPTSVDPKFLCAYLSSPELQRRIHAEEYGVTRQALTKDWICNLQIPLPPLPEQHRIVAKLDSILPRVEKVRERLEKIPVLVKRFRQSVLTAAVTGKLTERWRNSNHIDLGASTILEKIQSKWTEKEKANLIQFHFKNYCEADESLPKYWRTCNIGAIGLVSNGSTPSRKTPQYWGAGYSWVSSGEVQNCIIRKTKETITQAGFNNSSTKLYPAGTVLIAMIGEGKTRGQTAILNVSACCNQNVAAVVIDQEFIHSQYLFYWFLQQYEANRDEGAGSGPK